MPPPPLPRSVLRCAAGLLAAVLVGCSSGGGGSATPTTRPSATTTTPPATGPGSRQQPIPFNTAANVSPEWQVKVVSVVPDATADLKGKGVTVATKAGRQPFLATVDVSYRGGGSASPLYSLSFRAVDGTGTYDERIDGCGAVPDPLPASEVLPGGTSRGSVCWLVPPAGVESLLMVVEVGLLGTGNVHFALR